MKLLYVLSLSIVMFLLLACEGGTVGGGAGADQMQEDDGAIESAIHDISFPKEEGTVTVDTIDPGAPDVSLEEGIECPGNVRCPCTDNTQCFSGFCIETMNDWECSGLCSGDKSCPGLWKCAAASTAPDIIFACVDPFAKLGKLGLRKSLNSSRQELLRSAWTCRKFLWGLLY